MVCLPPGVTSHKHCFLEDYHSAREYFFVTLSDFGLRSLQMFPSVRVYSVMISHHNY